MKILHYIFFLANIRVSDSYFIQNQSKKICADCKFFIANKETCGKFGNVDIITGKYTFDDASKVREDETKCGEYAIFYKENRFKFITRPYYYIQDNWRDLSFLIISISAVGAYATIAILSLIRMLN